MSIADHQGLCRSPFHPTALRHTKFLIDVAITLMFTFALLLPAAAKGPDASSAILLDGIDPGKPTSAQFKGSYECYTGEMAPSIWEYPRDGSLKVEWESPVVSRQHAGKEVTFAIACALGTSNGDKGSHTLSVNGKPLIKFNTPYQAKAVWEAENVRLTFHALRAGTDLFGIMHITLSPMVIEYGRSVHFAVRGEASGSESWFMVHAMKNISRVDIQAVQQKKGVARTMELKKIKEELRPFQDVEIGPEGKWDYMIPVGSAFPPINWQNPEKVGRIAGQFELKTRWFNRDLKEVTKPTQPGPYFAYIEGNSPKGFKVRRALTIYCRPENWHPWENRVTARVNYPPQSPIDPKAWQERTELLGGLAGAQWIEHLQSSEQGAIQMAYLADMKPQGRKPQPTDTPKIANDDVQVALKRKIMGVEGKYPPLQPPTVTGKSAPVLRAGTEAEAGVKPETTKKIRALCQEWYRESGEEPFAILVANRGVKLAHDVYGKVEQAPLPLDTPFTMASVTKNMTGLLFAEFLDQGLVSLDDPIGKYLPDFPTTGDQVLTLRQCFMHTTGLEGHYEWGGVHNPWLDNVIANGASYLNPGKTFNYTGMGYDLAGKVMEVIAGKSVIRLMHENLFEPLGVKNTTVDDLACATTSCVEDLARMAQLYANKGTYGNRVFFSPAVFEQLRPRPLDLFPDMDIIRGIGCIRYDYKYPNAGKDGVPKDRILFGKNTIAGLGSGGSSFIVALDSGTIIIAIRNAPGKATTKDYYVELLKLVEDSFLPAEG